jgi:alpha-tubulin suppressor-like RCC1 family protein
MTRICTHFVAVTFIGVGLLWGCNPSTSAGSQPHAASPDTSEWRDIGAIIDNDAKSVDNPNIQTKPDDIVLPWKEVAVGSYGHICGIDDTNALYCWGGPPPRIKFGQVSEAPAGRFIDVSSGAYHSCAVRSNGSVECWGPDDGGRFDYGQVTDSPTGTNYTEVSVGDARSCARHRGGTVDCWGVEDSDGPGFGQVSKTPKDVRFLEIDAGNLHTCGITKENGIFCWGVTNGRSSADRGQVSEAPDDGKYINISGGALQSCAVTKSERTVVCWGVSNDGQIDYGQATDTPVGEFKSVSAGFRFTCGIRTNGKLECWGITNGENEDHGVVTDMPSGEFNSMNAGLEHSCGIDVTGKLNCWGRHVALN